MSYLSGAFLFLLFAGWFVRNRQDKILPHFISQYPRNKEKEEANAKILLTVALLAGAAFWPLAGPALFVYWLLWR